jgi:hypothetical protein
LNDLQEFLEGLNIKGIDSINEHIENEVMVYLKTLIHLYPDDKYVGFYIAMYYA